MILVEESSAAVQEHVEHLAASLTKIVADGVQRGELVADDPAATGRAILDATARFHNPTHRQEWSDPQIDAQFEAVWSLLLKGLTKGLKKHAKAARAAAS